MPILEPVAVRGLFGAIAADRHAAPSSRASARMVGEYQRAARSLACFDAGEVFVTYKSRQNFTDRQQQRFRGSPAPHHAKFQAVAISVAMPHYLAERFVALQDPVQRTEFPERLRRERPAHMFAHEAPEPFAQGADLVCNFVQITRHRSRLQRVEYIDWNKLGLRQPLQEAIAAIEPVNRRIDRRRDGVQEIEAERVGDKDCWLSVLHDWSLRGRAQSLTCQVIIDKLCGDPT
jgi:hypothetical protein